MNNEHLVWLPQMSNLGLVILSITVVACILIIATLAFLLLKGRDIKTLTFSATERSNIMAESRELSDNQLRTAKILVGSIRMIMETEAEKLYPNRTPLEMGCMSLLFTRIVDNLLEQYRIDLVRNHIVKKNEEELRVYTQAKACTYHMKTQLFLNDYNYLFPDKDLKDIMKSITLKQFNDIYYDSYKSAKDLSSGY